MFRDADRHEIVAERLLDDFTLEDLLEMNNVTDTEALAVLFREGFITQPERIIDSVAQTSV